MSSSFLELPDDILFNVVKFLRVPDILAARKTCKRLQAITMSRNVWTTMYKMSRSNNGFVPRVASLVSQTILDLECLLWRVYRLEILWGTGVSPNSSFQKIWSASETAFRNVLGDVQIYQGHYLVIQTCLSIIIYDIETKHEVFRQETAYNEYFDWIQSHILDENAELCLPFETRSSEKILSMLKMSPSGVVTVTHDCPALHQLFDKPFVISNEFAVVDSAFIVHLPSQKLYPLSPPDRLELVISRTVTFVSGGYALIYSVQPKGSTDFELYRLPDHTVVQAGTPVPPTHRGTFQGYVAPLEPFLSSDISSNGSSGSIWMFFCIGNSGQLYSLRIVLQQDGHLSFRLTTNGRHGRIRNTHWTHLADGKTRVITEQFVGQEWEWVLYDVSIDSEGEPSIRRSKVDVLARRCIEIQALDASQGILAVYPDSSYSEISIVDLAG
ncbi:hypothetical protein BDP27DRAFT_1375135 [Rhodocollybia butyracea]|uniref:F-box domain-containing protein n=1 Tax=Rhodocollybia butyracea TaxID=206335 RepID=A0A9P5P446_9AGAR|nr:hypothetical protein BDP27DRAFT_1375135 [Rhodocollybia butyracea]